MSHKAFVFDAYGTLFDVHAAVRQHAGEAGPDGQALSEIWRAKQLEYSWIRAMTGTYRDFWQLTEEALDYALTYGRGLDRGRADKFVGMYVNDYTIDIGDRGMESARLLLKLGRERGFITSNAEPEWI